MTPAIAMLIALTVPYDVVVSDRADVIEPNHYHDDCGRHVFDQVIFWDWDCEGCLFHVRDWRMVKQLVSEPAPGVFPHYTGLNWQFRRDWERDCWVAYGRDGTVTREVKASAMRESWEQYDPELAAREVRPKERRRGLAMEDVK